MGYEEKHEGERGEEIRELEKNDYLIILGAV